MAVAVKAVTIAGEFVRQRRGAELAIAPAGMTVKGSRGDDLSGLVIEVFELDLAHDSDFSSWPGIVNISPKMLTRHNIIGSTVGFSCNYCDLGDAGFRIGKK